MDTVRCRSVMLRGHLAKQGALLSAWQLESFLTSISKIEQWVARYRGLSNGGGVLLEGFVTFRFPIKPEMHKWLMNNKHWIGQLWVNFSSPRQGTIHHLLQDDRNAIFQPPSGRGALHMNRNDPRQILQFLPFKSPDVTRVEAVTPEKPAVNKEVVKEPEPILKDNAGPSPEPVVDLLGPFHTLKVMAETLVAPNPASMSAIIEPPMTTPRVSQANDDRGLGRSGLLWTRSRRRADLARRRIIDTGANNCQRRRLERQPYALPWSTTGTQSPSHVRPNSVMEERTDREMFLRCVRWAVNAAAPLQLPDVSTGLEWDSLRPSQASPKRTAKNKRTETGIRRSQRLRARRARDMIIGVLSNYISYESGSR